MPTLCCVSDAKDFLAIYLAVQGTLLVPTKGASAVVFFLGMIKKS